MARMNKKRYAVVAGVAAVALSAGAAFAYWTSTGTGSATSTTGSSSAFTVEVTNETNAALSPDGPTDDYTYVVTNTNDGVQALENQPVITVSTADANCLPQWYEVTNASVITTPLNLASGGTYTGSFSVQLVNDPDVNQDACQGEEITLTVDVS